MLEYYRAKSDEYGQQMSVLLRGTPAETSRPADTGKEAKEGKEKAKAQPKHWLKVGSLPVNIRDSSTAMAEVMLRIVEDYKARIEKTSEALKSLASLETVGVGEGAAFTMFVNKGVPEALIIADQTAGREIFSFAARFRSV